MEYTYEVVVDDLGTTIKRTDQYGKVWWIPEDPSNTDYQAYLVSLDEVPA